MQATEFDSAYNRLSELIAEQNSTELGNYIDSLSKSEFIHALFQLSNSEKQALMLTLSPTKAAELIEDVPESYAVDVLEEINPEQAASIVNEMPSDEQANILQKLPEEGVEEILSHLDKDDANELRTLLDYPPDVAGGLMMTEFLCFPDAMKVKEVITDLTNRSEEYSLYNVQYLYVVDKKNKFLGVLRLRDLVFSQAHSSIGQLVIPAFHVEPNCELSDLKDYFDEHELSAFPVVDSERKILGVVRQKAVDLALADKATTDHQRSQGIVSGEELRSMPIMTRSKRRLSWLSINIVLNMIAASVIAMFQDTLTAVIALAVFLPIVSDMSGCSGNQSVAVSMRELTLGIVRPNEVFRVWFNEIKVGIINGIALGTLLSLAAWLWQGNPVLGIVVGGALALNTVVAVSIGGTVPLFLKRFKIDPAIASGPILTTVTDMCGFFFVLGLGTLMLEYLV